MHSNKEWLTGDFDLWIQKRKECMASPTKASSLSKNEFRPSGESVHGTSRTILSFLLPHLSFPPWHSLLFAMPVTLQGDPPLWVPHPHSNRKELLYRMVVVVRPQNEIPPIDPCKSSVVRVRVLKGFVLLLWLLHFIL